MKNEIIVTATKSEKGEVHAVNAALVGTVKVAEIQAAEDIRVSLCYNLMAGTLTEEIPAAIKSRKLSTLLGSMARADQNAIRNLADKKPADIVKAWESDCATRKRVRGVTIQALNKAYNAMFGDKKETAVPFKEQFLAIWSAMPKKDRELKANKALFDLAVDAGFEG